MTTWLCPVKPGSWRTIRKSGIFGMPSNASATMKQVNQGDFMVFHVLRPVNGIVAVCKVVSTVFEDYEDIWGKGRYPLRVKIELVHNLLRDRNKPIPLSSIFGVTADETIEIEPLLKHHHYHLSASLEFQVFSPALPCGISGKLIRTTM